VTTVWTKVKPAVKRVAFVGTTNIARGVALVSAVYAAGVHNTFEPMFKWRKVKAMDVATKSGTYNTCVERCEKTGAYKVSIRRVGPSGLPNLFKTVIQNHTLTPDTLDEFVRGLCSEEEKDECIGCTTGCPECKGKY
ncbi:Hypothetical protein POVN_LOCUS241, partial [uncultured virus]